MTLSPLHQATFSQAAELAADFCQIDAQLQQKNQQLIDQLATLSSSTLRAVNDCQTASPVGQAIAQQLEQLASITAQFENKITQYQAGLNLRNDLDDSLLLFVIGKVKAGKSALGNYLATGLLEPSAADLTTLAELGHQPTFFMHEDNHAFTEQRNYQQGFKVGVCETTSCIQGFSLPGLTWVDSPGLHSLHQANGELAKKYVESADAVLYVMNSAQVGLHSDFAEIIPLLRANKRIIIVLTRSDINDVDVDQDGNLINTLAMKSDTDRQAQIEYVKQALASFCQQHDLPDCNAEVISLSVAYAAEHHQAQDLTHSGVEELFKVLSELFTSEGLNLKKQVPINNLAHFYRQLLTPGSEISITDFNQQLDGAIVKQQTLAQQFDQDTAAVKDRILTELVYKIDDWVETHADERNIKAINEKLETFINQSITQHYQPVISSFCQQAYGGLTVLNSQLSLCQGIEFKDETATSTINYQEQDATLAAGAGTIAGGLMGTFVAGPLGSFIGSLIGYYAGDHLARYLDRSETYTFVVGDNRDTIKDQLNQVAEQSIIERLDGIHTSVYRQVFEPIRQPLSQLYQQSRALQDSIQQEQAHV